jgi:hypothetical protein
VDQQEKLLTIHGNSSNNDKRAVIEALLPDLTEKILTVFLGELSDTLHTKMNEEVRLHYPEFNRRYPNTPDGLSRVLFDLTLHDLAEKEALQDMIRDVVSLSPQAVTQKEMPFKQLSDVRSFLTTAPDVYKEAARAAQESEERELARMLGASVASMPGGFAPVGSGAAGALADAVAGGAAGALADAGAGTGLDLRGGRRRATRRRRHRA